MGYREALENERAKRAAAEEAAQAEEIPSSGYASALRKHREKQNNPWQARHGGGDTAGGPGGIDLPEMADDPALYLETDWQRKGAVAGDALARGASGVVDMLVSAARSGVPLGISHPRAMHAIRSWLEPRQELTNWLYREGLLKEENLPVDRPERAIATTGEYVGATAATLPIPAAAGARYAMRGERALAPNIIKPYTKVGTGMAATGLELAAGAGAGGGASVAREAAPDSPWLELALGMAGGFGVAGTFAAGRRIPAGARRVANADPRKIGRAVGTVTGAGVGGAVGAATPVPGGAIVGMGTGAVAGSKAGGRVAEKAMGAKALYELQRRKGAVAAGEQILASSGVENADELARLIDQSNIEDVVPGSQPTLSQRLEPPGKVPTDPAARKVWAQRKAAASGIRTLEEDLYRNDVKSYTLATQKRAENVQALRRQFDDLSPGEGDPTTPFQAMNRHVDDEVAGLTTKLDDAVERSALRHAEVERTATEGVEGVDATMGAKAAGAEARVAERASNLTRGNKATRASEVFHEDMVQVRGWWLDRVGKVYDAVRQLPRVKNIPITGLKRWAIREIDLVDEAQKSQIPKEVRNLAVKGFDETTSPGAYEWSESIQRLQALDEIANAGMTNKSYSPKRQWFYRQMKKELDKVLKEVENEGTTLPIRQGVSGSDPVPAITIWRKGREMARIGNRAIRDRTAGASFGRNVVMPKETTSLGKFFVPDARGGKEGMDDFNAAIDIMRRADRGRGLGGVQRAQRAEQAMRDHILGMAAQQFEDGGSKRLWKFIRNYDDALNRFPGIRREIRNLARASNVAKVRRAQQSTAVKQAETKGRLKVGESARSEKARAGEAQATYKADRATLDKTAAAIYAKANSADEAMQELLASTNRKKLARELWVEMADAPEAREGMKRAFWDEMWEASMEGAEDATGALELNPQALRKFVAKNRDVFDTFFDSEHRKAIMDLANAGEELTRPIPKQTRQRLDKATEGQQRSINHLFQYVMGAARTGGGGKATYAADVVAALVEKFPNIAIQDMIQEALMSKGMAVELARKVTPANKRMVYRRLHAYLTRLDERNRQRPQPTEEESQPTRERFQGRTALQ